MEKLTKKQKIFLIIYPFLHCLSTFLFMMMALATGDGCPDTDLPVTWYRKVISAIGSFFSCILWSPFLLLEKVGVKLYLLPAPVYIAYLRIFLIGILYGYIILYTYKFLRKK